MPAHEPDDVARLLEALNEGHEEAGDQLFQVVYGELRRIAHSKMRRERPGHTLQTTALVHEAYLRLVSGRGQTFKNRAYFFRAAAEAMRRILVERARRYAAEKHGGGKKRTTLQEDYVALEASPDLLALDDALAELERIDRRKSDVVKLRYFVGLNVPETAALLGVSPRTVDKDWQLAKAWLHRELDGT